MSQCGRIVLGRLAFSFDRQEAEIARRPFRPARRFIYRTQVFWLRTGNSQTSDLTSAGLVLAYLGENCLGGNGAGTVGIRYQAAGVRGGGTRDMGHGTKDSRCDDARLHHQSALVFAGPKRMHAKSIFSPTFCLLSSVSCISKM